ncbi:MAG: Hint domain-containing protein [Prevotella sp.]|nr:Hint domain-containing protein [Prevotella sp.]
MKQILSLLYLPLSIFSGQASDLHSFNSPGAEQQQQQTIKAEALPSLHPKVERNDMDWLPHNQAGANLWQKEMDDTTHAYDDEELFKTLPKERQQRISMLMEGKGPYTLGNGCSWYCGGGADSIYATSHLSAAGKHTYDPGNIHDFNLFTAWAVTGNKAVGQRVSFRFPPHSPRANILKIWNGYVKSRQLWQDNARVKELKLYVNGKPTALLQLADAPNQQTFAIQPLSTFNNEHPLILSLEITKIYKGKKYDDVVISEINFDGLDVHCFDGNSSVLMGDKTTKMIRQIKNGDIVMTYDFKTQQLIKTKVTRLVEATHPHLEELVFEDGTRISVTNDHPFYTPEKGWCAVNPDKANSNYIHEKEIRELQVGDKVMQPHKKEATKLLSITHKTTVNPTYTIEIEAGNNFIVNGLLVKTEKPTE